MKKIYRQANAENGWTVDYKTLQQIKDSNIDWSLGMEEIEQVILSMIKLDYLKMYDEIDEYPWVNIFTDGTTSLNYTTEQKALEGSTLSSAQYVTTVQLKPTHLSPIKE